MALLGVVEKNARLQTRAILLADPGEFDFLLHGNITTPRFGLSILPESENGIPTYIDG